ncbi:MAG: DUF6268 family outer membrane beta-barrel protein [Phycisphaerales bacterium]
MMDRPLAIAACMTLALPALAQPAPEYAPESEPGIPEVRSRADFDALSPEEKKIYLSTLDPVRISLSGGATYTASSFEDIAGDVDVLRIDTDLTFDILAGEGRNLTIVLGQERSFYDFDDAAGIIPAAPADNDPISDAQRVYLRPTFDVIDDSGWGWFLTGSLEFAGEPGAVFDDSFTIGGGGGVTYQVADGLRLGLGVLGSTRVEESGLVIPFPIIEWTIAEDWSFNLGRRNAGAVLAYQARDDLSLSLGVSFGQREYRLDDDNVVSNGVLIDRGVPITLAAAWKPSSNVTLTGRAGTLVAGEIEFTDSRGNRLNREDRDPGLIVGFDLRIAF